MKGQFVIIDLRNMNIMKDENGNIIYYNNIEDACDECGMYEFENVWILQLMFNHIENEVLPFNQHK